MQRRGFFKRYFKMFFIALIVICLFVVLFSRSVSWPKFYWHQNLASSITHPVSKSVFNGRKGVAYVWNKYINLIHTYDENLKLKEANNALVLKLAQLEELDKENKRLSSLLSFVQSREYDTVGAQIIGYTFGEERKGFYISAGKNQGVFENLPVVAQKGVVGTVKKVFQNSSLVIKITDPSHSIDGINARSRTKMIVRGSGSPLTAELLYVDRSENIKIGDEIITSGLDGIFPKGISIGHLTKVEKPDYGVLQHADLVSSVNLVDLEEVLVVKNFRKNNREL